MSPMFVSSVKSKVSGEYFQLMNVVKAPVSKIGDF